VDKRRTQYAKGEKSHHEQARGKVKMETKKQKTRVTPLWRTVLKEEGGALGGDWDSGGGRHIRRRTRKAGGGTKATKV